MTDCAICGGSLAAGAVSCTNCGAPATDRASEGESSECRLCNEKLWSLSETCVHCGARGYPALRPRLGDKSLFAPDEDDDLDQSPSIT